MGPVRCLRRYFFFFSPVLILNAFYVVKDRRNQVSMMSGPYPPNKHNKYENNRQGGGAQPLAAPWVDAKACVGVVRIRTNSKR